MGSGNGTQALNIVCVPAFPRPGCFYWKDQEDPISLPDVDNSDEYEPSPKRPK